MSESCVRLSPPASSTTITGPRRTPVSVPRHEPLAAQLSNGEVTVPRAEVPPELLAALMPQLHLPVQSGSDRILAAMNRRHTAADYLAVIDRLHAARPDLARVRMAAAGLPMPEVLVSSKDVAHGKPEPDCFLKALERFGVDAVTD